MAKRKIYKNDGSEDFDAEALEPDETSTDAGNVSDLIAGGGEGKADAASATSASDNSATAPSDTGADKSASTDGGESTKPADAQAEATASAPAAELPELGEVHPEAQAAVDLDPVIADVLKDVGNKVTPLFEKFREADAKLHEIEDEAKTRFAHVRQKATELVAALESWFARG